MHIVCALVIERITIMALLETIGIGPSSRDASITSGIYLTTFFHHPPFVDLKAYLFIQDVTYHFLLM